MTDSSGDGKLPVSIVTTVIDKISDFTKEMEVLRAQLPNKETTATKLDGLDRKIDSTLSAIKLIFGLAMVVVGLAFFGAQLIDWYGGKTTISDRAHVMEELIVELKKESRTELDAIFKQRDAKRAEELEMVMDALNALNKKLDKANGK